jgi:hypothetical protein
MTVSRRKAILMIGGGVILGAGAAVGHIATRAPLKAIEPWTDAGDYEEIRRFALSYAILAPNPHNLQPWLVDLRTPDTVILSHDKARTLPETDPFGRQLTIGFGCFLELMVMAAASRGHAVDLDLYPDGEDGPIAVARFREGAAEADALFRHALSRRSVKEPYEDRLPDAGALAALTPHATIITDPALVDRVKTLSWEAWIVEAETPRTYRESVDLMRFGKAEIEANPDGIDLGGGMLELLIAVGVLSREAQLDPTSTAYAEGFKIYEEMLMATPAYATIATLGNTRADQIEAGRKWLRLNLAATGAGIALHPISQALQEYPEMAAHFAKAHDLLGRPGETVQMLGRVGYGPKARPAPRWPLETKIAHG